MNLIRETLTTVIGFCIPECITIGAETSDYHKDDDDNRIEYYGYDAVGTYWEIGIILSGCEAIITASVDCTDIKEISVNLDTNPYLDGPIMELITEIEKELMKYE